MSLMKRLLLCLLLCGVSCASLAQDTLPSAASILDRYIEVTGGKGAWQAIRTEVRRAAYELPSTGVKMAMTAWRAAPNRSYLVLEAPGPGRVEEGTDGDTVWNRSTMQGPRVKQGEERDGSLLAATLNSDLRWREIFPEAETRGVEDVGGQPCYRVELRTAGGLRQVRFYSRETGLLIKSVLTMKGPRGEITTESYLTDYRSVSGILVPFKTLSKVLGQAITITVESLEFNPQIDPAVFAVPDDIRALLAKETGKLGAISQAGPTTNIHAAARKGELARIRELLGTAPELLNLQDQLGRTPLLEAVLASELPVATFLVEKGADVNMPDREGQFPLLIAALLGANDLVKSLLAKGAEPNGPRHVAGFTPLHLAARNGHQETAGLLLARGASVSARDRDGRTPLAMAASEGRDSVIGLLLTRGAMTEAADRRGSTPLLLAALNGHQAAVKLLVSKGADVNARNSLGSTPVGVALRERHTAVADMLLAAGARKVSAERPVLQGDYLGQMKPGRTARLFAPGVISTEKEELNSVFTPDGREFYFAIRQTPRKWTIMVMKRTGNRWGKPEVASFSGEYSDVDVFISPDGQKLFYCSNRPLSGRGEPKKDVDIWVVERAGDSWSEPRNLGPPVNSDESEFYPSVTRTGTLCFQSVRPDCRGARDIYCARLDQGTYRKVDNLGSPVNTEHSESDPFLSPEGDYIVFSRDGPGGFGQGDLHVSFRAPEGGWTEPKRLGPQVNTEAHENCPMVTPDGKFLFFTRAGDIYWVDARIIWEHRRPGVSREHAAIRRGSRGV